MSEIDCYVLAGGYGTRLSGTFDGPKFLAPVRGVPVGQRVIERLATTGARRIVLGLGHQADEIAGWLLDYQAAGGFTRTICVVEPEPRGTAAALRLALPFLETDPVLVVNGDTLWDGDLEEPLRVHQAQPTVTAIMYRGVETGYRLYSQAALRSGETTFTPYHTAVSFIDVGTPDGLAEANAL